MVNPVIQLSADFDASPLWTRDGNVRIEDLPLSPRLAAELRRWADDFDATTPRGPRMTSRSYVPSDWVERGRRLAQQLQAELDGSFEVQYDP